MIIDTAPTRRGPARARRRHGAVWLAPWALAACFGEPSLDPCDIPEDCALGYTCARGYCYRDPAKSPSGVPVIEPPPGAPPGWGPLCGDPETGLVPSPIDSAAELIWTAPGLGTPAAPPGERVSWLTAVADGDGVVLARLSGEVERVALDTGAGIWRQTTASGARCPARLLDGSWVVSTSEGFARLSSNGGKLPDVPASGLAPCVAADPILPAAWAYVITGQALVLAADDGVVWSVSGDYRGSPVMHANKDGDWLVLARQGLQGVGVHELETGVSLGPPVSMQSTPVTELVAGRDFVAAFGRSAEGLVVAFGAPTGGGDWNVSGTLTLGGASAEPSLLAVLGTTHLLATASTGEAQRVGVRSPTLTLEPPAPLGTFPPGVGPGWHVVQGTRVVTYSGPDRRLYALDASPSAPMLHRFFVPGAPAMSTTTVAVGTNERVLVASPEAVIAVRLPCVGASQSPSPWPTPRGSLGLSGATTPRAD